MASSQKFRQYLYLGVRDARAYEWEVDARAAANVYTYGQRIRPHYHHGCDFVAAYYVDLGDGSKPDFRTNEEGRLVALDPRGAVQYPFGAKTQRLPTEVGMLVIHPAQLWHESETFFSGGVRVVIYVEFSILHDHRRAFRRLPRVADPNPPLHRPGFDPAQTIFS